MIRADRSSPEVGRVSAVAGLLKGYDDVSTIRGSRFGPVHHARTPRRHADRRMRADFSGTQAVGEIIPDEIPGDPGP